MYVIHVVQAHANVRPKAGSCGVAHSAHGTSRATRSLLHTQSSSREHIIYMPPPHIIHMPPSQEHQALVLASSSSTLASTPQHSVSQLATICPASSTTTSPQLRSAAGMLAKIVAPFQRATTPTAVKPGSGYAGSGKAFSAGKFEATQTVICLPDGTGLLLNSLENTLTVARKPSVRCLDGSGGSSTPSCKLPAVVDPAAVMLHRPAASVAHSNKQRLISRGARSSGATGALQFGAPAHPSAAAWVQQWQGMPEATAAAAAAAREAAAVRPWSQSSVAAGDGVWAAVSSSKVSTAPAFGIPGYGSAHGAGPVWDSPLGGGSGSHGSGFTGGSRPGAGSSKGTSFAVLPAASIRLAKLGVGLMGLAAAAGLACLYWSHSPNAHEAAPASNSTRCAALDAAAAAAALEVPGPAAAAGAAAAADAPAFHEWMVRRLQCTLQQFDAEQKLLQTELHLLRALNTSKSKAAGSTAGMIAAGHRVSAAGDDAAGSSSGPSAWGRVVRWLGLTGSSSTSAAQYPAAASAGGNIAAAAGNDTVATSGTDDAGDLTPAGIAARMADIREQIDSLDVLKAALSAEVAEQQRQQLRAEATQPASHADFAAATR